MLLNVFTECAAEVMEGLLCAFALVLLLVFWAVVFTEVCSKEKSALDSKSRRLDRELPIMEWRREKEEF